MEHVGWKGLSKVQQNLLELIGIMGEEAGFDAKLTAIHTEKREHCTVAFTDPGTGLPILDVLIEMDSRRFIGSILHPFEELPEGFIPHDQKGNTYPERRIQLTAMADADGIALIAQRVRDELDACAEARLSASAGFRM